MKTLRCIAILVFACWATFAQSAAGGASGVVHQSTGGPVPGVFVIATPVGPAGGKSLTAVTNLTGEFSLTKMPPGAYMLCVQGPGECLSRSLCVVHRASCDRDTRPGYNCQYYRGGEGRHCSCPYQRSSRVGCKR